MRMFTITGTTNTGIRRTNNEDRFFAGKIWDDDSYLAIVIDGVGGYEGGEIAADIALTTIEDYLNKQVNGAHLTLIREAVIDANEKILAAQKNTPQYRAMSCVITACIISLDTGKIYMAHVGDTRLYSYQNHILQKLSHDHSLVGYREELGDLSEEEAMKHPQRNEVTKTLGEGPLKTDDEDFIESNTFDIIPGATYLLCSDGLTDMLTSAQIATILSGTGTLADKCQALVDQANAAGGADNITVVLAAQTAVPLEDVPGEAALAQMVVHEEAAPDAPAPITAPISRQRTKMLSSTVITALASILINLLLGSILFIRFRQNPAVASLPPVVHVIDTVQGIDDRLYAIQLQQADSMSIDMRIIGADTTIYIDKPVVIHADNTLWHQPKPICFEPRDSSCRIGLIITGRHCQLSNITFQRFHTDTLNCARQ